MSNPCIIYSPRPDAVPESEVNTLANVYRFILESHGKKKASRSGGPDDAEEPKNDRTAKPKYNR